MSKMQNLQDWLRKYLFWCLCGGIALFSLAAWWLGTGTLTDKSKANLAEIEGNFKKPSQVTDTTVTGGQHPNDKINSEVNKLTLQTRKTVLDTWKDFYNRQEKSIYKWPALLDNNFQAWIKANPWNVEIPFDQLDEYQNKVLKELERIVTTVANAEWPDAVAAAAAAGTSFSSGRGGSEMATSGAGPTGPGVPGVSEKLLWEPTDITAYKNRYKWSTRPSTTEVRLAQEDLWVLEQLCRVISQVNGDTPPYQRPIKVVKKIAIEGYALDGMVNGQPHGINTKRILRVEATTGAPVSEGAGASEAPPAEGAAPVEGAPAVSAPPTRLGLSFSGGAGASESVAPVSESGEAPAAADGAATKKAEDVLYDWRYIDQKGYPLSKAQLDGDHKNDLYRMLPFKIQMHIVQSQLPKLLETFKDAPLTLEVTQIRINYENNAANQFANVTRTAGGDGGEYGPRLQPHQHGSDCGLAAWGDYPGNPRNCVPGAALRRKEAPATRGRDCRGKRNLG
jgi:hypothetical protein